MTAQFSIGAKLGADSDGRCFEATKHCLMGVDRPVVLKVAWEGEEPRLEKEARLLSELGSHPNILQLLDWRRLHFLERFAEGNDTPNGEAAMVLAPWEVTLEALLAKKARLDWTWGEYVGLMILRGLEHVHSKGWLHGDRQR